jgi:hypothetical protein
MLSATDDARQFGPKLLLTKSGAKKNAALLRRFLVLDLGG